MMVHIIENTEQHLDYEEMLEKEYGHLKSGVSSAIGYSSVLASCKSECKVYSDANCFGCNCKGGFQFKTETGDSWNHTERKNFKKNVHILGSQTAEVSGSMTIRRISARMLWSLQK